MNAKVKESILRWSYVAPVLKPARNAKEYAQLVKALDCRIRSKGQDAACCHGAEALRYLMQRDNLRHADLPEGVSAALFL